MQSPCASAQAPKREAFTWTHRVVQLYLPCRSGRSVSRASVPSSSSSSPSSSPGHWRPPSLSPSFSWPSLVPPGSLRARAAGRVGERRESAAAAGRFVHGTRNRGGRTMQRQHRDFCISSHNRLPPLGKSWPSTQKSKALRSQTPQV